MPVFMQHNRSWHAAAKALLCYRLSYLFVHANLQAPGNSVFNYRSRLPRFQLVAVTLYKIILGATLT